MTSDTMISKAYYIERTIFFAVAFGRFYSMDFRRLDRSFLFEFWRGKRVSANITHGFKLFKKLNSFQDKVKDMQYSISRLRILLNKKI